jgi:branched-chain amino acid transport system permease protein
MLFQQIFSGIATGCIYALIGLALILVYKATDIINFAVGEMMMMSSFMAYTFLAIVKLPYYQVFFLTILFSGLFGILVERLTIRPVFNAPVFSVIILTFGLGLIFKGAAGVIWTFDTLTIRSAFSMEPIKVWKLVVTPLNIGNIAISVTLMLVLFLFFKFTVLGTGIRAMAQNRLAAILMGIKVKRISTVTWSIASMIGGVAGILFAPVIFVDTNMGVVAIKSFVGCIIGGFGSIPGCILGGILLGTIEAVIGYYLPTEVKQALVFLVLIGVLCIKPTGIFGVPKIKKI